MHHAQTPTAPPSAAQVLQRATSSGVGPIVCYTTDDTKLEQLVRCAKENAGTVYCLVGIHSDNIKRANDRCALRTCPSPTPAAPGP